MRQDKWNKPFRPGQSEEAKQEQKRNKVKKLEKKAVKLGILAKRTGRINRIINKDMIVDQIGPGKRKVVPIDFEKLKSITIPKFVSVDFETVDNYWQVALDKSKSMDYGDFERKYMGTWPDDTPSIEEARQRAEELRQREYEVLLRTFERLMEKHKRIMEHWK